MFIVRTLVLFPILCSNASFDLTEIGVDLLRSFGQETNPSIAEDARLTVPQLITKYGYDSEIHHVTTEDGYILELHRIAGGPKSPPRKGKKVCFLMHGVFFTSAPFVFTGPNALAYRLVDEDFDIWMGNVRGTIYSTNHTIYNAFGSQEDKQKYWSFSLHEIGYYDVPASIDYVLNETGETKMNYLGYSQGSTTFFIMASEKPEYMDKIEMLHSVAPAVYLSHTRSPSFRLIANFDDIIDKLNKYHGFHYAFFILPIREMCGDVKELQILCERLFRSFVGETDQTNTTLLPVIFGHVPVNAGVRQFLHFIQFVNSGRFRKFDYGPSENLMHYNQPSPPGYDLRKATIPVAVYYAVSDWLTTVEDVRLLIKDLPNVVDDYLVPHRKFNHADFVWGRNAGRLVYDEIVKNMK